MTVSTDGYGGRHVHQGADIRFGDDRWLDVTVTGYVETFADIRPTKLRLYGHPGEEITDRTTITPKKAYPFHIVNVRTKEGRHIKVELADGGPPYALTVTATTIETGTFADKILIETDSDVRPVIEIPVYIRISK